MRSRWFPPLCLLFLLSTGAFSPDAPRGAANAWRSLGPDGGLVQTLAIDPSNPATIYAGTWSGGIFKTTNGGLSWRAVNAGLTTRNVRGLALDPAQPSILYAATAKGNGQGGGVFKTVNGGESWVEVNNGLQPDFATKSVDAVAVDPLVTTTLYAVGNYRLFKSTDGATSWVASAFGIEGQTPKAIVVDPSDSSVLYLMTNSYSGVLKSVDGGRTWMSASAGLPAALVSALAIDPQRRQTLYAGTAGNGVFKSVDGGASWTAANAGITTSSINVIAIDPRNSSNIYAGAANGVFGSTDGGLSWRYLFALGSLPVATLAIAPSPTVTVYAGDPRGVRKSEDAGSSWENVSSGLRAFSILTVALDPSRPSTIFASTSTPGQAKLLRSWDSGQSWTDVTTGLISPRGYVPQVYALTVDPSDSAKVYAGTSDGIFKSADGGTTWAPMNTGLPGTLYSPVASVGSLVIDPRNPSVLYAAFNQGPHQGGGVAKSEDSGSTWRTIRGFAGGGSLAMDPQDSSKLFASVSGFTGTSAFVTADAGATWNLIPFFFPLGGLRGFAIDPRVGSNVYAGGDRIWKSTDGGANWIASDAGLAINQPPFSGIAQQVSSIVIDPTHSLILYAGTSGAGIFRSGDAGAHWNPFNRDLENLDLTSLALDSRHPAVLYAGTNGNGLFAATIDLSLRSPREVRRLDFRQ